MRTMQSECMPWRTPARVQLSPSSALIMTPCPTVPTRMVPLLVMVTSPAYRSEDSVRDSPRLYTARNGSACRSDLRRGGVRAREVALGSLVPAPRVVEITLEDVHDSVNPRRHGGFLLLDDLVRLLPVARRQELDRLSQRLAHVVLLKFSALETRRRPASENVLAPRRRREKWSFGEGAAHQL